MRIAITGAASGIGAATAALLKKQGAEIVAFDIVEPKNNVDHWIDVDMSDPGAITRAASKATGTFDALLNIAGLPPREGQTAKVLQVNYFGLIAFTEEMLGKLNKGASIVNLASRAGSQWRENLDQVKALMSQDNPDHSQLEAFAADHNVDHIRAYNLTKEAVIVWTMAQTEQMVGMDLRMNSVSPSAVSTGILDDFLTAFGERAATAIARAGRPGTADEISALVAFLASPESGWIKGNDIVMDGGMSAMAASDALGLNA